MRDHWCRGDHWSPGIILWTLSWSLSDPGPSVGCWFRSLAKLPGAGTGERFRFAGSFLWPLVLRAAAAGRKKAPALISGSSRGNSGNASTALAASTAWQSLAATALGYRRGSEINYLAQDIKVYKSTIVNREVTV